MEPVVRAVLALAPPHSLARVNNPHGGAGDIEAQAVGVEILFQAPAEGREGEDEVVVHLGKIVDEVGEEGVGFGVFIA